MNREGMSINGLKRVIEAWLAAPWQQVCVPALVKPAGTKPVLYSLGFVYSRLVSATAEAQLRQLAHRKTSATSVITNPSPSSLWARNCTISAQQMRWISLLMDRF